MNRPTDRPFTVGLYLNIIKRLGLSLDDLTKLNYGTVLDMIIERSNNDYEYKELATQEDFDRF